VPLAGAQWLSLIPVVAVERLLAAGVAVAMVQVLASVKPLVRLQPATS